MPKINIKVSISDNTNNDSYEIKSIIQDEIIKYKEKDNTLVKYDLNKNILTRENDNLRMEYVFNKENENAIIKSIIHGKRTVYSKKKK